MSEVFNNYMHDLVRLIKEDYNQALSDVENSEDEADKTFNQGKQLAFYSVLDLIESQLKAFDIEEMFVEKIVPILGEKAEL